VCFFYDFVLLKFPCEDIYQDTPGYIALPDIKDRAHCVAVVVDGSKLGGINDDMKNKLRNLRAGLITRSK
jgi:hypothetical protein